MCVSNDTISPIALGIGPYLSWRNLSIEAMHISYLNEPKIFGATLSDAYWRYDLALKSYSNEEKSEGGSFIAEVSYTLRSMPHYHFLDWNEQSGFSVKWGYQF
jgi:hypothetical protein